MAENVMIDSGFEILGKILSYYQANPNDAKVCVCLHGPKNINGRRMTVKAISKDTDIKRTTVNDVLSRLIKKEIVKKEKLGRFNTYALTSGGLAIAKGYIKFVKETPELIELIDLSKKEKEIAIAVTKRW